jgi:ribosomal protein L11 methyltransferase
VAWQSLSFEVAAPDAHPLSEALLEAGAQSVSIDDADAGTGREAPQFAEPGESPQPWERNRIIALFDHDAQPAEALAAAVAATGCSTPGTVRIEPLADRDWVRAVQDHFVPLRIAERLWVVPSWCEPPEPDAINLRIDPGLAFGTGSHPSTRLALGWLARALFEFRGANQARAERARVLDYGCGSGILAIAASKLGAGETYGVDIDPQALATSAENAACNLATVRWCPPGELSGMRADIVVANILARPLIVLAPLLAEHAADRIALSGILVDQAEEVLDCYREWFEIAVAGEEEGWVLLSGRRR